MRIRAWEYRQQTKVCRVTRPTRHDKAHKLGYKAKEGYAIFRSAVRRGSRAFRHLLEVGRRVVARCRRRRDGGIARVGDEVGAVDMVDHSSAGAVQRVPPPSDSLRSLPQST